MKKIPSKVLKASVIQGSFLLFLFLFISPGCQKLQDLFDDIKQNHAPKLVGNFNQVNLVANNNEYGAAHIDPLLINAWGLAFSGGGTPWVANQGSGTSTIYNSEGVALGISPVFIPSPGGPKGGNPTGVVFHDGGDFVVNFQISRFIFAGVDGIISAWYPGVGSNAIRVKDNSATSAYTGLALAKDGGFEFLYAANFRTGKIDVFDRNFNPVSTKPFVDPNLPAGYAPFNIQNIGGKLYVAYAKVGPDGRDVPGVGLGYVDIYNPDGSLMKRFASKEKLNAPWGLAQAPAGFFNETSADFNNAILIGNFGDGRINVYSWEGKFLGQLAMNGKALEIEGLWALMFPPTTSTIDPKRLYFTAGPDDETHGLFGYLIKK